MLNRAIIMGRLTRDPELRYTPNNIPVTTVTVAVDRGYARQGEEKETDFLDVVCWRQSAEFVSKWFRKGQMIVAEGRIQTRKWKDKYEQNRVTVEIVADNVYFGEGKNSSGDTRSQYDRPMPMDDYGAAPSYDSGRQAPAAPRAEAPKKEYNFSTAPIADFKELADDDDVPF